LHSIRENKRKTNFYEVRPFLSYAAIGQLATLLMKNRNRMRIKVMRIRNAYWTVCLQVGGAGERAGHATQPGASSPQNG
jgi:hypothetical protein